MTSHYIDISAEQDAETSIPQVMGALYARLHLALVERGCGQIGVSFPRYSTSPRELGSVLRVHGDVVALDDLMKQDWLKGVRDHVRLSEILPVPDGAQHRTVLRRQFKTNADRLRRRRMKRKGETEEQAIAAIPSSIERSPDLPFVRLRSASTAQPFHLFIALGPLSHEPSPGEFSTYGLSGNATIPWF